MDAAGAAHLEPARFWDELIDRIGDWRIVRRLSYDGVDALVGLTRGHPEKNLGPSRMKGLTPRMLDDLLPAFGIQLLVVEDPAAVAAIQNRWEQRCEANVRRSSMRVSKKVLDRARPHVLAELIDAAASARAFNHTLRWSADQSSS